MPPARLLLIISLSFLTGCSTSSLQERTENREGKNRLRYQESRNLPGSFAGPWWHSFSDDSLNLVIKTALLENLAQKQLTARIEQASARLQRENAALFPKVDLNGSSGIDSRDPGDSQKSAPFGSFFSWELDLWGRLRSGVRARRFEASAAFQDWLGGRLLLSASVAETRILILEQRSRLALLQDQIKTNETLLSLVRLRVGQGQASRVDLLQQERQLDATRALIPPAEAELAAAQYALDVLTGVPPGAGTRDSRIKLPDLPALPSTGIPANLLANRPDLLAQWNRILALDAEVGQALADRLPRLTINGNVGAGVFDSVTGIFSSLIAEATGPLFDAGARRSEIELRRAALKEALLGYSNLYLEAIRDVESSLVRERKQSRRIELTQRQLATAREALNETRIRYSQGLTDYLPVIDALSAVQSLELSVLGLRRESLYLRIALHRAIGGPMPHLNPPAFSK